MFKVRNREYDPMIHPYRLLHMSRGLSFGPVLTKSHSSIISRGSKRSKNNGLSAIPFKTSFKTLLFFFSFFISPPEYSIFSFDFFSNILPLPIIPTVIFYLKTNFNWSSKHLRLTELFALWDRGHAKPPQETR